MKRFFNIDIHISIIHDIKHIFRNLGHEVDSVCFSDHCWVNKEKPTTTDVIDATNWKNIDQDMCDRFYYRYKDELKHYRGFVHSYPPAFAMLFEKFNKPIITIACTRFEYPCIGDEVTWLINGLQRMIDNGQLISVANNLVDKKYCETYTKREWIHISSLCDYMECRYSPKIEKFIVWNRSNLTMKHPLIDNSFTIYKRYNRNDTVNYKGVIHFPYNLSIMSAFEQYYCDIPIFVPTPSCIKNLTSSGIHLLSELSFPNSPFKIGEDYWPLADWLDDSNMPHTIKYESVNQLADFLYNIDFLDISNKMIEFNRIRKERVYNQWKSILKKI